LFFSFQRVTIGKRKMTRQEILQKIAAFPLAALSLSEDILSGDFRSVFRGQGIEADEVRRYEIGDDVRAINWNVSARFGAPYVKIYREERELSVFIVLDCSASMGCGSVMKRSEQAVLCAALLAFSAESAGQRVGSVFFDQEILKIFQARKGRAHSLAMVSGALDILFPTFPQNQKNAAEEKRKNGKTSDLGAALAGLERILKRRSVIIIISDFFCMHWEQELGRLCRKHDAIAIRITDPLDTILWKAGLINMEDPETGARISAATGFSSFRSAWGQWHQDRSTVWNAAIRRAGASPLEISTKDGALLSLTRFFRGRKRG
jgi:uncharacterized protein (DUF58 family)